MAQEALSGPSEGEPCGACKYLRRKCRGRCIFAPHFGTDQGSAKIAAVHKVFGANIVLNLLSDIPPNFRHEAATTISYEAQARLSDPVYGCVSTVLALQQQVTTLQAKLTVLQNQLVMNTRFSAYATAIAQQHEQQQPNFNVAVQPAYSNNSSATTTNLMNMSNFNPGFDLPMDPPQPSRFSQYEDAD